MPRPGRALGAAGQRLEEEGERGIWAARLLAPILGNGSVPKTRGLGCPLAGKASSACPGRGGLNFPAKSPLSLCPGQGATWDRRAHVLTARALVTARAWQWRLPPAQSPPPVCSRPWLPSIPTPRPVPPWASPSRRPGTCPPPRPPFSSESKRCEPLFARFCLKSHPVLLRAACIPERTCMWPSQSFLTGGETEARRGGALAQGHTAG